MNVRTPIFFGFMIALLGTLLMITLLGLDLLGPDAVMPEKETIGGTILFLMIYLFLLFGIYLVLKRKKDNDGGRLTFKRAMIQGLITSFSTAFFSVIFTILFYEVIYPDYVTDLLIEIKKKMELAGIPKDKIEMKLLEKKNYYSTNIQSMYSFIGNLLTGFTFTLLLGFFLKTKK